MEEERGMKKAYERTLRVEGCSTPGHGPERSCWKVVDEDGGRPIQGVTKEVADLYTGAAAMAQALLANGYVRTSWDGLWHTDCCNEQNDGGVSCFASCVQARAALQKAGVLK
jgi:hypothetical protein